MRTRLFGALVMLMIVVIGSSTLVSTAHADAFYLRAMDATDISGTMGMGTEYASGGGSEDPTAQAFSSMLVFSDSETRGKPDGEDWAKYTVNIPHDGEWFFWGRFYFPARQADAVSDGNSFFLTVGDQTSRIGNHITYQKWMWLGDGNVEVGEPRALPLGFLAAGSVEVFVRKREVEPIPPRLDLLFFTDSADDRPSDDAAASALNVEQTVGTMVRFGWQQPDHDVIDSYRLLASSTGTVPEIVVQTFPATFDPDPDGMLRRDAGPFAPGIYSFAMEAEQDGLVAVSNVVANVAVPSNDAPGEPMSECGDVDASGSVTAVDALSILRASLKLRTCSIFVCDVNASGDVTSSDALLVLDASVSPGVVLECPDPIFEVNFSSPDPVAAINGEVDYSESGFEIVDCEVSEGVTSNAGLVSLHIDATERLLSFGFIHPTGANGSDIFKCDFEPKADSLLAPLLTVTSHAGPDENPLAAAPVLGLVIR